MPWLYLGNYSVQFDLGVNFDLGSAKMFSTVIFETFFFYHKDTRYMNCCNPLLHILLPICAISIDSCTSYDKFYSFITFGSLINSVDFLLNCLILIYCPYIYFISLQGYFFWFPLQNWQESEKSWKYRITTLKSRQRR